MLDQKAKEIAGEWLHQGVFRILLQVELVSRVIDRDVEAVPDVVADGPGGPIVLARLGEI